MMDPIVVRMYCGGMDGYQVPFCRKALAEFAAEFEDIHGRKIQREYKYVQDMRKDKWDHSILSIGCYKVISLLLQHMFIKGTSGGALVTCICNCIVFGIILVFQMATNYLAQYFCNISFNI